MGARYSPIGGQGRGPLYETLITAQARVLAEAGAEAGVIVALGRRDRMRRAELESGHRL